MYNKSLSHHTRALISAIAVPVVSFALAATAWFGGQLPQDHASQADGVTSAESTALAGGGRLGSRGPGTSS